MSLPRNAKVEEKRVPCAICGAESSTHPDGVTPVCAGCDGQWCRHVDELADGGRWPAGKWHDVWKAWFEARRRRAA